MMTLSDIKVSRSEALTLKGVSLEIHAGEVVALIGANGAGKTTTLMTISGIIPIQSGSITFCGETLSGLSPDEIVKKGVCHVPEGRRIFSELTILENLDMGGYLQPDLKKKEAVKDHLFSLFPVLFERRFQLGGTLSGGEQ